MARIHQIAAVMALAACGNGADPNPGTRELCRRSFLDVLDAWEAVIGDVPRACRNLDADYTLEIVDRVPVCASNGGTVAGCHVASERAIYIKRRDEIGMIDTAAHEWTHALSLCATGDEQADHTDPRLWLELGAPSNVEGLAIVNVGIGTCE